MLFIIFVWENVGQGQSHVWIRLDTDDFGLGAPDNMQEVLRLGDVSLGRQIVHG